MSTLGLMTIAVIGILVLLLLIVKFKVHPFLALLVVSIGTALAAGVPLTDVRGGAEEGGEDGVITMVVNGFGDTLGQVAVLVALGAMLGRMIEVSGGASSLANRFTGLLGPDRIIAALTAAAMIFAIPVFFDVGFIILVPIIYGFARALGVTPVTVGLPIAGIMMAVHNSVPPHPGIVGATITLNAHMGWVTIIALAICVPLAFLGYYLAKLLNRRDYAVAPGVTRQPVPAGGGDGHTHDAGADPVDSAPAPPSASMVVALIVLPIALIGVGSVSEVLLAEGSAAANLLGLIGHPLFALLVAVALAIYLLGYRRSWSSQDVSTVLEEALPPTALIILITGAGGAFGTVLAESGIGDAVAEALVNFNIPIVVAAYLVAAAVRVSQGSGTVATLTAAGLMAGAVTGGDYGTAEGALITVAIGFGALIASHVNDSGFWVITRFLGLSVADGLKTVTVMSTVLSLAGFSLTALTWVVVT